MAVYTDDMSGDMDGEMGEDSWDYEQQYSLEIIADLLNKEGFSNVVGLMVTTTLSDSEGGETETFTFTANSFSFGGESKAGLDVTLVLDDGTLDAGASTGYTDYFTKAAVDQWYGFADSGDLDQYAEQAVNALFDQIGLPLDNVSYLDVSVENTETTTFINIKADKIAFNGESFDLVHIKLGFDGDGKLVSKTGITGSMSDVLSDSSLEIWWEYSSPDDQLEHDKQEMGYFDGYAGDAGHTQEYSNVWTWEDWEGTTWTVVDKDVDGVWSSTETGSNGDVRINSSSWNDQTQENTWTESFTSDSGLDYIRKEVSGSNGVTITTTGTTDEIAWQFLGETYTNVNVVEIKDAYWNTTSLTGTGDNSDGVQVSFGWNASSWQVTIDGEAADSFVDDFFGFDDFFADGSVIEDWSWTDWDGTEWKVSEQDVDGTWTTTETAYLNDIATGDVRIFTSSWDQDTDTSTWLEHFISTEQGVDYTRAEVWTPDGTTVTHTGTNDHIGWMYLGELYTDISVTETLDANWSTIDITGTAKNAGGSEVLVDWDVSNWKITIDGVAVEDDDSNYDVEHPQGWVSDPWEWQDGEGVNWTVVDKSEWDEGTQTDTWTSTQTGDNGDERINVSTWNNDSQSSTWTESYTSDSKGLDFTVTETYNQDGSSSTHTQGSTDRIGWMPLDGVYTAVDVTETRNASWETTDVSGTGINPTGEVVTFGMQAEDWGGYQLTMDAGNGAEVFDPWAKFDDSYSDPYAADGGGDGDDGWSGEDWSWTDYDGSTWTVKDSEQNGVWTSTETNDTTGEVRVNTSTWDDASQTSTWIQKVTMGDGSNFTITEVYNNSDNTSSARTEGTTDRIGWMPLDGVYTDVDVTETRNANWDITSLVGNGVNTGGETVEFGWDADSWQITIDGDEMSQQGYEDFSKSDDNYAYEWTYEDWDGTTWTVTDKQDGDTWVSEEVSELGDVRVNKSTWDDVTQESKFITKYTSADWDKDEGEGVKYKIVDIYNNATGASEQSTTGTTDYIGWDYIGEVYTDVDVKVVRDSSWNITAITSTEDNSAPATVTNTSDEVVEVTLSANGQMLIGGKDIHQLGDAFFDDFGDDFADEFFFADDAGGWTYTYTNHLNETISVEEKDVDNAWTTIETNDNTGEVVVRTFKWDSDAGMDTEVEKRYISDGTDTGTDKYANDLLDSENDLSTSSGTSTFRFFENNDGGYSWEEKVVSSEGEDFTRTENYHEDGTTTIKTVGDIWFEGMFVNNAEVTETLDQYWNLIDYSGTSDLPDEIFNEMGIAGLSNNQVKVLISLDQVGDYGEPNLRFTIVNTVTGKTIAEETNYQAEMPTYLEAFQLNDGDGYVTSRQGWEWVQESFVKDTDTQTTIVGSHNADTITVVETRTYGDDGLTLATLSHKITTSTDENYNIVFKIIETDDSAWGGREGVAVTYTGTKEYFGELYNDVDVTSFGDRHTGNKEIQGTARGLDGSDVEFFKPDGQDRLELVVIGRDGTREKFTEDQDNDGGHDQQMPQAVNEVYQWSYEDHEGIQWTVVDKYDGVTWSSIETTAAGDERSFTDSWTESGQTSVIVEALVGQPKRIETRTMLGENTADGWKDVVTVVTTKDGVEVENYTETMVFNPDYSSTRTITGVLEFEGVAYTGVSVTETKDAGWQTTSLSGTATRASDSKAVVIAFDSINAWGDPLLTYTVDGVTVTEEDNSNANPVAAGDTFTGIAENSSQVLNVLLNDSDPAGDALAIKAVGDATYGKVFLIDGDVAYTPNYNWSGTDSFTYTITDGRGGSDTATVSVTVDSVNEDVVANNDSVVLEQDSLATVLDLVGNDTDGDGDTITVEAISTGTISNGGTVTLLSGVVSYKPAEGFSGSDSFDYTVNDGNGTTDTATVNITVNALNQAPEAVADAVTLKEDVSSLQIDVLANDSDAEGQALTVGSVGTAENGTVELIMGYVFYTPDADYAGVDTFTYTAVDSEGATIQSTVSLTVNALNDAVMTVDDVVVVKQDSAATTIDVMANDTDAESDSITVLEVGAAAHGTATLTDGIVTYTPTAGFSGSDTFTYTVTDGLAKTIGTVGITVSETNLAPVAVADTATVLEDSVSNKVAVLDNDSDPNSNTLTLDSVSSALYGTATVTGNNVVYVPGAGYEGLDSFTYTVSDGKGGSTKGSVTVTVRGVNDAPVAVADSLGSISSQGAVKLDVLANDYDMDSDDSISIKSVGEVGYSDAVTSVSSTTTTAGNRVTISGGKISYTASKVSSGADSFDYTIVDESGVTATATATLSLSSNTNPSAVDDEQTLLEDASATEITVLSNDTDLDSDKVQIREIITDPTHGTASVSNGKLFYVPDANYSGTDTLTYGVKDGRGGLDEATVTLTLTAVNDAPTANSDTQTIETGASATVVSVLGNDFDVDGDTLTVTAVQDALQGTVSLTEGVISYTPKTDYTGNDSFSYTVSDGTLTATATATIIVGAANIAPVAVKDVFTDEILEDSKLTEIAVLTNDTDADGDTLSVAAVTQGEHGKVALTAGAIFYTPDADYYGSDSFTYTVTDGSDTATSIVTLTVTGVADAPVAMADNLGEIQMGSRQTIVDLLSNDTDADGDSITIASVTDAKYGTVAESGGVVYYTPGSVTGTDSFTYTINGGSEGTAVVTVTAANSMPTGVVSISGAAQTGATLTASNTLADADGIDTIAYQWYKDGSAISSKTGTTYAIALEDAGSTFSVKASYTDKAGTTETVASDATDTVTQLDQPFSFASETVTGAVAKEVLAGYTFADDDVILKLTLNLDIESIYSRSDITSITGADLDFTIDWSQFSVLESASAETTEKFAIIRGGNDLSPNLIALNSSSTSDANTFDALALASIRINVPLLTVVDNDPDTSVDSSVNLIEVYVRPADDAGKLALGIGGTVSANQGQVTFTQYDATLSNMTNAAGNSDPTGTVTVIGTVAVDEVLTASHNLADEDGLGVVSYQWLRDAVAIDGATNAGYTITNDDINTALSVTASYTDDGDTAESETSSSQTVTQSTVNKPLFFTATLIEASDASIEIYGADYSLNPTEVWVKLALNVDMDRFDATNAAAISSIAGAELAFDLDWTLFEDIEYTGDDSAKYEFSKIYTGSSFLAEVTNSDSEITGIVASSLNVSKKPTLTLVDSVESSGRGVTDQPSTTDLLAIYLNPKDTVKDFEVTFSADVSVNQGASTYSQLSHSLEVSAKTYDVTISTGATDTVTTLLTGVSVNLWSGGSATGTSVAVDTGEISIDSTVGFDAVKLSVSDAYDFDSIGISDAIDILRHIVNLETLAAGSASFHAADVDNDGDVDISDAIDVLRHIVDLETIDTFDLIDKQGARVTQLDANATGDAPAWTLVANGDVDLSGSFAGDYVVQVDVL